MLLLKRFQSFLPHPAAPAMDGLYRICVMQTRDLVFYQSLQVPDTVDGRFDLLVLHVFLVMHRLGGEPDARQALFDLMFADMDVNLREMGVGDMSVGKKIRPMIAAFYGRSQAYERALNENDGALLTALRRNLYGASLVDTENLQRMVDYVRGSVKKLEIQSVNDLVSGKISFAELGPSPSNSARA